MYTMIRITKTSKININDIDYSKPINYYQKLYGFTTKDGFRKSIKKLGIYDNFECVKRHKKFVNEKKRYDNNPSKCIRCENKLLFKKRKNKYCSSRCFAFYTQKSGGYRHWSTEEKRLQSILIKSNPKWISYQNGRKNKILKICPHCKSNFEVSKSNRKRCCSKECSIKWSKDTGYRKGKSGGYRKNSGRGKQGWYKGYYCQSSWELAWVIYQLDHQIIFERNTLGFEYELNNERHKFYPDFILENGDYVEIKGYDNGSINSKISHFPHKLIMVWKNDIKPYVEYVENKYGKNFIELYEGNPHNNKKNKCKLCGMPSKNIYCSRRCSGRAVSKLSIL